MIVSFHANQRKRDAKRMRIYVKKQAYRDRMERMVILAYEMAHGDKEEALRISMELIQLSDEQLVTLAEYLLIRSSPLRRMNFPKTIEEH